MLPHVLRTSRGRRARARRRARLLRRLPAVPVVLGIYGFMLGAMIASSMIGTSNTTGMIVAALVGGLAGAVVLMFAYFVGIALVGAGLGALVAHVGWKHVSARGDPPAIAVIVAVDCSARSARCSCSAT